MDLFKHITDKLMLNTITINNRTNEKVVITPRL